jgi:hypothetical protein
MEIELSRCCLTCMNKLSDGGRANRNAQCWLHDKTVPIYAICDGYHVTDDKSLAHLKGRMKQLGCSGSVIKQDK